MSAKAVYALTVLLTVGALSYLLRALPFILFGGSKEPPAVVKYIGRVLAPAAIAMLVVYCFCSAFRDRGISLTGAGVPELIAAVVTVGIQLAKRNPLCSILAGTAVYMVLLQTVFTG